MSYNHTRTFSDFKDKIDLIQSAGFNLIGVSQIYLEDVFIFETDQEALRAYTILEDASDTVIGWWYGKDSFNKEVAEYEETYSTEVLIYWL